MERRTTKKMYKLFTEQETYNFTCTYGIVDYVWNIKGLSIMAKTTYQILFSELKKLNALNKLKVDHKGIYVELARSVIGKMIDRCEHTVGKYIKELQRFGLLVDRRMGVNLCNRIYLKYRFDAKRYRKNETKKDGVSSTNNTPSLGTNIPNSTIIFRCRDIISQLTDECLHPKTINQILHLCKDNLEEVEKAVAYCFGKEPKVSYTAMLFDTIKNRRWEQDTQPKVPEQEQKAVSKKPSNRKPKANSYFNSTYTHDFNLVDLEKMEILRQQYSLGYITKEQYEEELSKLNAYN